VLAGHSYGGYVARVFRALHPDRVAGMLLVESGHEDQWTRLPAPLAELTRSAAAGMRELAAARRAGKDVPPETPDPRYADPQQRRRLEAAARTPGPLEALASIIESMDSSTAQTRRSGPLADLPLVVVSARRSFDAFRHLPIPVDSANAVWAELQRELARLSRSSVHLWSESGDHDIHLTDPAAVHAGFRTIVHAVRARRAGRDGAARLPQPGRS
jgi:pimeloyl-ACP methyl ester carboxylesterase